MRFGLVILQEELDLMIIEHRASSILYHFLISKVAKGVFVLPVNICPIVPLVFESANIQIEYCDINLKDYCIDYKSVIELIEKNPLKYSGVLFNHSYGFGNSPTTFFNQLKKVNSNILIIDDKCLCVPDFLTDSLADLTLFSTGHSKYVDLNIGGIGILKTSESLKLFTEIKLKNNVILKQGIFKPKENEYFRIIQEEQEKTAYHKKAINDIYYYYLKNAEQLGTSWNNWRFNILVPKNSDLMLKDIFNAGFFASKHYKPMNFGLCPNAEKLYYRIVNLFNDKNMSIEKAEELAKFLNKLV
jgi:dTDP-4-amino-4,6-dideoxygalactose transaminase